GAPLNFEVVAGAPGAADEVQTIQDIINRVNSLAPLGSVEAFIGNNGALVIQRTQFQGGAAQNIALANVAPNNPQESLGLSPGTYASTDLNNATYDDGTPGDTPAYSAEEFPAFQNLPGSVAYNNRGWWEVR